MKLNKISKKIIYSIIFYNVIFLYIRELMLDCLESVNGILLNYGNK